MDSLSVSVQVDYFKKTMYANEDSEGSDDDEDSDDSDDDDDNEFERLRNRNVGVPSIRTQISGSKFYRS